MLAYENMMINPKLKANNPAQQQTRITFILPNSHCYCLFILCGCVCVYCKQLLIWPLYQEQVHFSKDSICCQATTGGFKKCSIEQRMFKSSQRETMREILTMKDRDQFYCRSLSGTLCYTPPQVHYLFTHTVS